VEDDWDEAEAVPIEDLSPATLAGVAERLRTATAGFVSLINRESELDALWTLADVAAGRMRQASAPPRPELPRATLQDLSTLCDLLFRAHDCNAEGDHERAADLVAEAARLCEELAA
jgi:hypothetical protein